MLNFTTTNNTTTVISAVIADVNAVSVFVCGVAHTLCERLDYWLFSNRPQHHEMQQPSMCLIKHKQMCCLVSSQSSGYPGSMYAAARAAYSYRNCDK